MSKSEMKRFKYQLPFDMARCDGREGQSLCLNCARKLSPWQEDRQAVFTHPPISIQTGDCEYYYTIRYSISNTINTVVDF
jgi:hypothetical protein